MAYDLRKPLKIVTFNALFLTIIETYNAKKQTFNATFNKKTENLYLILFGVFFILFGMILIFNHHKELCAIIICLILLLCSIVSYILAWKAMNKRFNEIFDTHDNVIIQAKYDELLFDSILEVITNEKIKVSMFLEELRKNLEVDKIRYFMFKFDMKSIHLFKFWTLLVGEGFLGMLIIKFFRIFMVNPKLLIGIFYLLILIVYIFMVIYLIFVIINYKKIYNYELKERMLKIAQFTEILNQIKGE